MKTLLIAIALLAVAALGWHAIGQLSSDANAMILGGVLTVLPVLAMAMLMRAPRPRRYEWDEEPRQLPAPNEVHNHYHMHVYGDAAQLPQRVRELEVKQ